MYAPIVEIDDIFEGSPFVQRQFAIGAESPDRASMVSCSRSLRIRKHEIVGRKFRNLI